MATSSPSPRTVDEYIAGFPHDVQVILEQMRATIRKAAPDAEETIKYRMPTFVLTENLAHFAAFKKHIGFYPTPSGIERFREELSRYRTARGSVQLPIDAAMPWSLIGRIVRFRVKEAKSRRASAR
jgi:uncharacterized protein YdhG (YjbR/CyaY superfamily)